MAEAFRITAEDFRDRVAVRTKDDEVSLTWGELRDRVDALAGGLAELGVERGDTVALMFSNRPEFHLADLAVMIARRGAVLDLPDLGAGADRLRRRRRRREARDRRGGLPRRLPAARALDARVVVLEGERGEGTHGVGGRRGRRPGVRRRERVARGRARRPADADLHLGHDRAAEGRRARAPQPARRRREHRADDPVPRRGEGHLVAAVGAHRRARRAPLPADRLRDDDHLLRQPARGRLLPAAGQADVVLRRPADLGEAQVGARGDARRAARRAARAGAGRARRRDPQGRARAGGRAGARGARRGGGRGRREDVRGAARDARARRGRGGQRRRGADAARGARVLPRHRHRARRAVGDVRDLRLGLLQPARQGPHRHRRAARAGRRDQARRRRRGADALGGRDDAATATCPRRPPRRSTPTAGCTPATSASSTTTATCGSSTARRS